MKLQEEEGDLHTGAALPMLQQAHAGGGCGGGGKA